METSKPPSPPDARARMVTDQPSNGNLALISSRRPGLDPQAIRNGDPPQSAMRIVRSGDLMVDLDRLRVSVCGVAVPLDGLQLRLLVHLAQHPDRVLSRAQLLADVWGLDPNRNPKVVDVLVCRLRKRLGVAPTLLQTVRGFGYRFNTDV